jgi:hypothetical protein
MTYKLVEDIQSLGPEILNRRIEKWDHMVFMELQPFIKEHHWHGNASINVFRVIGTKHPDYVGMTWIELLQKGKRMKLNLGLHENNPQYYYGTENKEPTMYYLSLDGCDLYIGADGNHRTCIAKADFFLANRNILHGVVIDDYKIDWELKKAYDRIVNLLNDKRLPFVVEPHTTNVSRDDSHGWMVERYEPRIKVRDLKEHTEVFMNASEASEFLKKLTDRQTRWFPWLRRW